ncbi:MAG: hypothetical protein JKY01_08320 [Pseudomonadales bacterium]|nr:hypothetical protein [Pseudomonadales bacterium]
MKQLLCIALFYVSIVFSPLCNALSLGDIKVESSLNQALKATIQIRKAGDYDDKEVIVRIAEKKQFDKTGIEYRHFYSQLKFTVRKTNEDTAVIHIQSHDAVVEPSLNFIIEVQTPQGRSFKQYTVFIEPGKH